MSVLKDEILLTEQKMRGFFKFEALDLNGNVIDSYFEENMIMDKARSNMCELISGVTVGQPINKFIIGTGGHVGAGSGSEQLLNAKVLTDATRTVLFSEELSLYSYPIVFAGTGSASGDRVISLEPDAIPGDINSNSTVNILQTGTDVTYTITLPSGVANHGGVVAYTEAGFYAGDDLFNMKTFPAKVKSNSVTIRITWKISF